jgi:2,5-diketo-D-gluconate reductase B
LLNYCRDNNIVITAYSPFGRGTLFADKRIKEIASDYEKSLAQIILRWLIQKGIVVIPRSSSEEHLKANLDVFDWDLHDAIAMELEYLAQ